MLNSLNGSVANTSDKRIKKYLGKLFMLSFATVPEKHSTTSKNVYQMYRPISQGFRKH